MLRNTDEDAYHANKEGVSCCNFAITLIAFQNPAECSSICPLVAAIMNRCSAVVVPAAFSKVWQHLQQNARACYTDLPILRS